MMDVAHPRPRPTSLRGQIDEVWTAIGQREEIFRGRIAKGGMRQGEADLAQRRLTDVARTLEWLERIDRAALVAFLAARETTAAPERADIEGGSAA